MTGESPQALLARVVDEFERRRWRDMDQASLKIVHSIEHAGTVDISSLAGIPSRTFLTINRATRADVREALDRALRGAKLAVARQR